MTIDVSTILKELGGKIDINGDVEMSDTDFLGEMYHFNEPVKVSGSVSNNGKSLILKANCTGHMTTQCARCMKDIVVDIDFDIDENLAQDDGSVSSDDDVILFEDVKIDIDDIVANNFLMNVEGKYLCSEDCKGLCQHCGADLNEGDCGCSPKGKVSKARRNKRRANWKLSVPNMVECPQCHEFKMPHKVCKSCGYYNGKEVIKKVED